MGFFEDLAGRVEEAAQAGGKFADSLVRTAGAVVSAALVFAGREMTYAQKAVKKTATGRDTSERRGTHKQG